MSVSNTPQPDGGNAAELQEYGSLRSEILKLVELQSQLVTLNVVAFGALLSVGFQFRNPLVVEVYPLVSLMAEGDGHRHDRGALPDDAHHRRPAGSMGLFESHGREGTDHHENAAAAVAAAA